MPQESRTSGVLRFNVFQVDLRAGELYKAGRKIKLHAVGAPRRGRYA